MVYMCVSVRVVRDLTAQLEEAMEKFNKAKVHLTEMGGDGMGDADFTRVVSCRCPSICSLHHFSLRHLVLVCVCMCVYVCVCVCVCVCRAPSARTSTT